MDARVDRLNLTVLLKDFMHLDPTTRYQVAKNAFIRELNEFRVSFCCSSHVSID